LFSGSKQDKAIVNALAV